MHQQEMKDLWEKYEETKQKLETSEGTLAKDVARLQKRVNDLESEQHLYEQEKSRLTVETQKTA